MTEQEPFIEYLTGEMSREERGEFLKRTFAAPDDLDEAAALKNAWAAAQLTAQSGDGAIAKKGWKAFGGHDRSRERWWQIAAVALLLVSLGLGAWLAVEKSDAAPVAYNTLTVPVGQYAKIALADGSEIWLNSRSSLVYPSCFTASKREVRLSGEGYFQVASDPKHPFVVRTPNFDITATGTKFNVMAYGAEAGTSATLVEGKVKINSEKYHINYEMSENQTVTYDSAKKTLTVKETADTDMETSWTYGVMRFKDAPLSDITRRLELNYNVKFVYRNEAVKRKIYTGAFFNYQSIDNILMVLKASTLKLNYEIEDDTVTLY